VAVAACFVNVAVALSLEQYDKETLYKKPSVDSKAAGRRFAKQQWSRS
jgi:hypothetical protein